MLVATFLVGGFVAMQVIRGGEPLGLDQGLFACFGRWLRDGWVPYRDMFDSKPPLHLYTWVLAWAGGSPTSAWVFEALWLAATCTLGFFVARRWWGMWAGIAAAALLFVGLWAPGFGGYWSRLQAEELLVLPELAAAWFALSALDRPRAAIACGAFVGVVGLYKVPGLAVAGAWLALWLASLPRREAWQRIGYAALGGIIPWLVASAWFVAHGAFGAFVDSVFFYQRHWIAVVDPPWSDVVHQFVATAEHELAPLLVAAVAGVVVAWRDQRARAICLVAWIGCAALAIVLQRQLAGYHFLLLVPGLAFAAASGITALAAKRTPVALAVLALIGLLFVRTGVDWARAYGSTDYTRDAFSPGSQEQVAEFVAAHSQPRDGLLVWALAPGIYALADRHPVTRFPFHRLLLTDARLAHEVPGRDARRTELLARMAEDPPALIVIGNHDANPFEPDSVTSLLAFPGLSTLVERDYHEVARFDRFVVLARNRAPR